MKKIALVTGAEGFIGSHMVRFLQEREWDVVGTHLADRPSLVKDSARSRFEHCDLRNGQRVSQLIGDYRPTHIFHFGAQSLPTLSWSDPTTTFESNIMGSLHLFEAVRRTKRRPVIVSACSSAEYGHVPASAIPVVESQPLHPLHPYGISKAALDMLAREYFLDYGIPAVNIRLFNTTGPGKTNDAPSDFVKQLAQIRQGQRPPIIEVGNLKPFRAFLDVRDTVRGFYLAAVKGKHGEAYNLCATRTYRMSEILQKAIRLSGVKPKIQPVARLMRPSDEKIIFGSTQKIRKDTGWKPVYTVDQTLESMLEHWDAAK
jgi:GDP-4-dehydro-6-deoxy-D-mannose reductase